MPHTGAVHRDDEVFTDFVRAHSAGLARVAYLMTGSTEAAEDLLQTALASAYARWGSLDDVEHALRFVRSQLATTNTLWRRRKASSELVVADVPDRAAPDHAGGTVARSEMLAALATLPTKQRAVIVLRYYGDLTEQQVADALGCSLGTVKTHASRGMKQLSKIVAHPARESTWA
jgi:RNA polymerase sigma-70 factor (sigma-E family)